MGHVGSDKVTSSESSTETELTSEYRSRDNTGQLAGILTRGGGVSATDTKQIQHRALGLEDGTTTNGTNFNGRHRHGNLEVTIVATEMVSIIAHEM